MTDALATDNTFIGSILAAIAALVTAISGYLAGWRKDRLAESRIEILEKRLASDEFMKNNVYIEIQNGIDIKFNNITDALHTINKTLEKFDNKIDIMQITLATIEKRKVD